MHVRFFPTQSTLLPDHLTVIWPIALTHTPRTGIGQMWPIYLRETPIHQARDKVTHRQYPRDLRAESNQDQGNACETHPTEHLTHTVREIRVLVGMCAVCLACCQVCEVACVEPFPADAHEASEQSDAEEVDGDPARFR